MRTPTPLACLQVACLFLAVALAGCPSDLAFAERPSACEGFGRAGPGAAALLPAVAATPPTPPLRARFEVCDPEAFFREGSRAVLELDVWTNAPERVVTGVRLPPGVEVVSGSLDSDGLAGGVDGGVKSALEAVLRGVPGKHTVTAWAELPGWSVNGSRMSAAPAVTVSGSEDGAEVEVDPYCCQAMDIRIDVSAEAENPSEVVALVSAPVPWHGHAHLWTGAQFDGEWRDVPFALAAGQTLRLEGRVRLPQEFLDQEYGGYHQVWVFVYPHASLSTQMAEEDLYYGMEGGRLVVLDEVPPEEPPEATATPCPTSGC